MGRNIYWNRSYEQFSFSQGNYHVTNVIRDKIISTIFLHDRKIGEEFVCYDFSK